MPKLINYLNRLKPARHYDEVELERLQIVYDRAREALAIDVTDPRRERLAILIFQAADLGAGADEILEHVVKQFGRLT